MQKKIKLPKDEAIAPDDARATETDPDVEGHRLRTDPDELSRRLPSSGGELSPRLPSTGGDLTDDDDVEGHLHR